MRTTGLDVAFTSVVVNLDRRWWWSIYHLVSEVGTIHLLDAIENMAVWSQLLSKGYSRNDGLLCVLIG